MKRILLVLFAGALAGACSRHDSAKDEYINQLRCDFLTECSAAGTRFGMVGDSWTDFFFGLPVSRDLHDWLITEHGYSITSSVIAGQTAEVEVNQFRGFERVIRMSGPNLKYMLISLGGNDMLANTGAYFPNPDPVLHSRLNRVEANLRNMIASGDFLKVQLYGGASLQWFIHGYDYPNPEIEQSCVRGAINAGMSQTAAFQMARDMVDHINDQYRVMAASVPNLHYIDLRGTLGGPPISSPLLKTDCIHPNDQGFRVLADRFALGIEAVTPEK